MVITFLIDDENVSFPIVDEILIDSTNSWFDSITQVAIGINTPLDAAVKRYFSIIRPVRTFISIPTRIKHSDLIVFLYKEGDIPLQGYGKPTLYCPYNLGNYLNRYRDSGECPF